MFARPKTTSYVAPAEPISVDDKYLVKLVAITDEGISSYADPAKPDPEHSLLWTFRMAKMDRTPILNIDGDPYEFSDWSSNKTGKSKTKTAKAREWAEALMGRSLENSEIDDELPVKLQEKVAVCLFFEQDRETQGGEAYKKLKILRLAPYKAGAPEPVAAPAPRVAEPAEPIPF